MEEVAGVTAKDASFQDFHRLFKCKNIHNANCNQKGLQYPPTCSFPPCNQCVIENDGGEFETFLTKCYNKNLSLYPLLSIFYIIPFIFFLVHPSPIPIVPTSQIHVNSIQYQSSHRRNISRSDIGRPRTKNGKNYMYKNTEFHREIIISYSF